MELIEQQVRIQYQLLGHEGFWTRVRRDDKQGGSGGKDELIFGIEQLITWARPLCGRFNLYLSRNPFDKEGCVTGVKSFTADLDPVREPKDRAATETESACAVQRGASLNQTRFNNSGVLCSSGNGSLLIVPFKTMVEDVAGYTEQAQRFERDLISEFSTPTVRIDATNYAKALVKLMGSLSTKGDPKLHRYARTVGPVLLRRSDEFLQRIRTAPSATVQKPDLQLSHGSYKSRSEADYAMAIACKQGGLGPEAALKALQDYSHRPDREDDHRRIIGKVFDAGVRNRAVPGKDTQQLWTPNDGIRNSEQQNNAGALTTGYKWLDAKLFGGYLPGRVYALEAPTNIGKSSFVVQAAFNLSRVGKRVLFVATEMDVREFCERYYALGTGIAASRVLHRDFEMQHRERLAVFTDEFKRHQIFVHYTTTPNQKEIERHIENVQPDIIFWDYFQHLETGTDNRQVQLGSLARWYESTALRFSIPIVVAAQLHERYDFKSRTRLPAIKDDIKDCKVLNDAAKVVMVIDWDKESIQNESGPVTVTLSIQKNKGPMGTTKLVLYREIPRFEEI